MLRKPNHLCPYKFPHNLRTGKRMSFQRYAFLAGYLSKHAVSGTSAWNTMKDSSKDLSSINPQKINGKTPVQSPQIIPQQDQPISEAPTQALPGGATTPTKTQLGVAQTETKKQNTDSSKVATQEAESSTTAASSGTLIK